MAKDDQADKPGRRLRRLGRGQRTALHSAARRLRLVEDLSLKLDFEEVLGFATRAAMDVARAQVGGLALLEADGLLHYRTFYGLPAALDEARVRVGLTPGQGLTGIAFQRGKPMFFADVQADPRIPDPGTYRAIGARSVMAIPIRVGSDTVGTLTVGWLKQQSAPSRAQTTILETIARQMGVSHFRDRTIRERTGSEQRAHHLMRLYATLSSVNAATVAPTDARGLFLEACAVAVREGKFRMAWVGVVDEETSIVQPVSFAGEEQGYLDVVRISVDPAVAEGKGPMGIAIRDDRIVVVRDFSRDPRTAPWRAQTAQRGFRSAVFCPLHRGGRCIGGLGIYAEESAFFDADEEGLAREIALSIDAALERLRLEAVRREAESRTRLLELAVQQSHDAVVITRPENGPYGPEVVFVNQAFTHMTGYTLEDMRTSDVAARGAQSDAALLERLRAALSAGAAFRGEMVLYRKDGSGFAAEWSAQPLRGGDGEITHLIIVERDISERKRSEERLRFLALHDSLTGLPNRALLRDRLQHALAKATRRGAAFAVAMLDLDNFKQVNDTKGHEAGDTVLRALGERLHGALRSVDTLARFGGDEFALLLEDFSDPGELDAIIQRALTAAARPISVGQEDFSLSFSAGVALYPGDGEDAETLLRRADSALYSAKELGGGRSRYFDGGMEERLASRSDLRRRLDRALQSGELRLFYQPQVDLLTGEVAGMEALVRWIEPGHGLRLPDAFLPGAEETGQLVEIGRWVLEEALRQSEAWKAEDLHLRIAINIAPSHFQVATFVEEARAALSRHPEVSPGDIEFEITESPLLGESSSLRQRIAECRAMGIEFALDDFGTGYSSITRLQHVEAGLIKIDQSFVQQLLSSPEAEGIVRGMVVIGRAAGRRVLAEGVETLEQSATLARMGCHLAQGFAFGRPMPADAVPAWVEAWRSGGEMCKVGLYADPLALQAAGARLLHMHWLAAVLSQARGAAADLPVAPQAGNRCAFSEWLEGDTRALHGDRPDDAELHMVHEKVHEAARRMLAACSQHAGIAETARCKASLLRAENEFALAMMTLLRPLDLT